MKNGNFLMRSSNQSIKDTNCTNRIAIHTRQTSALSLSFCCRHKRIAILKGVCTNSFCSINFKPVYNSESLDSFCLTMSLQFLSRGSGLFGKYSSNFCHVARKNRKNFPPANSLTITRTFASKKVRNN